MKLDWLGKVWFWQALVLSTTISVPLFAEVPYITTTGSPSLDCRDQAPEIAFNDDFRPGGTGKVFITAATAQGNSSSSIFLFGTTSTNTVPSGALVPGINITSYININSATASFSGTTTNGTSVLNIPIAASQTSLVGQRFCFQAVSINGTCTNDPFSSTALNCVEIRTNASVPAGNDKATITHQGFTWDVESSDGSPLRTGRFFNGDPWVKVNPNGSVRITRILPQVSTSGTILNGSMIDPDCSGATGYTTSSLAAFAAGYSSTRNAALVGGAAISVTNPLVISMNGKKAKSLVSTKTNTNSAFPYTAIESAAVLTFVDEVPFPKSFRPQYAAHPNKEVKSGWNAAMMRENLLPAYPQVAGSPSLSSLEPKFQGVRLDHISGWNNRSLHPLNSMSDYGRDLTSEQGDAAARLMETGSPQQKRTLLTRLTQIGIDYWGNTAAGCHYFPEGGHGGGRKFMILFSGFVLNDSTLLGIGQAYQSYYNPNLAPGESQAPNSWFSEDAQVFRPQQTSTGQYNYGVGGYTAAHVGLAEYGNRHGMSPWGHPSSANSDDNKDWYYDSYRRCCTANSWGSQTAVVLLLGLKPFWNNNTYFDYVDRYMWREQPGTWTRSWTTYGEAFWDTNRFRPEVLSQNPYYNCTAQYSANICMGQ